MKKIIERIKKLPKIVKILICVVLAAIVLQLVGSNIYRAYKSSNFFIKGRDVGDTFYMGDYEQDAIAINGKEPLEWVVIDKQDGKILVTTKKIIEVKPFDTTGNEELTWESSELREFLNGEFVDTTFSKSEQSRILSTTVTADSNPTYEEVNQGNDTEDKVFVLSIDEMQKYYPDELNRQAKLTVYSMDGGMSDNETTDSYWLRTMGCNNRVAAYVKENGEILNIGVAVSVDSTLDKVSAEDGGLGVRPVMWISVE